MPFIPLDQESTQRTGFVPLESQEPQGFVPLADSSTLSERLAPAVKTMEAVGSIYPVLETVGNLGTQAIALPVAGVAGIGAAATNALGLTDTPAAEVVHAVGDKLTYHPQTELGRHLAGAAMYPFEKLAEGGRWAGDKTLEVTGSPVAATAVDTAINALPMVIAPGVKGAKAIREKISTPINEAGTKSTPLVDEAPAPLYPAAPESASPPRGFIPLEDANAQASRPRPAQAEGLDIAPQWSAPDRSATLEALRGSMDGGASLTTGIKEAGLNLLAEDKAAIIARARELRTDEGLPIKEAGRRAVGERIALLRESEPLAKVADSEVLPDSAMLTEDTLRGFIPLRDSIDAAAHEAATSPLNELPQPSRAQIESGNYKKGTIKLHGLDIAIENPKGSIRSGVSPEGKPWQTEMQHHYGYIKRSLGKDGDAVDVFIGPKPESQKVFVIDQVEPKTGRFDEHKAVIGAETIEEAKALYQANYEPGWKGAGAIKEMSAAEFKDWVRNGNTKAPVAIQKVLGQPVTEYTDAQLARLRKSTVLNTAGKERVALELQRRADQQSLPVRAQIGEAKNGQMLTDVDIQPMAAPVQNGTWNPGANYQPFVDQVSAPASGAKTVADLPAPLRRERIIKELADALGAHVYEGRVKGKNRLGFFRRSNEETRIKRAGDIEVAAHELAHLLDSRVPKLSVAWRTDKALREELKSVSYDQKSASEGFAESVRLWATQADALEAKAPRVFKWLEDFANSNEYGPALRRAQHDMTAWFEQDGLNRARSKIGDPGKFGNGPVMQYLGDWWKEYRNQFRQSVSDDLAGLYDAERSLTGKIAPAGAYETARLSRAAASITDGAIRFGAPLRKADGSHAFTGKGLHEILQPIAGRLDDFLLYAVGRSAQELMGQGREHLFSKSEIAAMVRLETPEFRRALNEFQTWNRAVVDFAQAYGVVNAESRAMWNRQIYLPFWRVSQPGEWKGAKVGDWKGVQALTGGSSNLRNVLGNVIGNANLLITKALVNDARARTVKLIEANKGGRYLVEIPKESRQIRIGGDQVAEALLKRYGIAIDNPGYFDFMLHNQAPAGGNVIAVLENGKPRYFEVGDPLLYRSLVALERPPQHWLVKWLGLPRKIGQASIVLDPNFLAANLARDQVMAGVMTQNGFRPVIDAMAGLRSRLARDKTYQEWVANGGGLSSFYLDDAALKKNLDRFYAKHGINAKTVLDTPGKMLYFVERAGDAVESMTRIGEYRRAMERGEHPRHAAYLAREVSVDWAAKGDSKALSVAFDTVMFLRAAVVSMDRVFRGVAHDPNRGAIAVKAGAIALASTALYLMNRGRPEYDDLEDWKKDAFWHVWIDGEHFMLPKAFEVGALASIGERTAERLLDHDPAGLGKDYVRIIGNTFGLNWKPQIVAPLYDQATNRNSFTKAPIETPGMQDLQPAFRTKPYTSETMKTLGQVTGDLPEAFQFNPVRAEALLRGYLNSWGAYALMATDALISDGKAPAMRTDQLPVVKRFYAQEPPLRTKYETQFFEMLGEARRLRGTLKELDELGRGDWADRKEQSPLAGEAKPLERVQKSLGTINRDMEAVRRNDILTPAEKRQKLDALTAERNALLKSAVIDAKQAQSFKEQARRAEATLKGNRPDIFRKRTD